MTEDIKKEMMVCRMLCVIGSVILEMAFLAVQWTITPSCGTMCILHKDYHDFQAFF